MGTPGNLSLRSNYCGLAWVLLLLSAALLAVPGAPQETASSSHARQVSSSVVAESYANLPLIFEPNVGQTDASVKFLTRTDKYLLFLTSQESVFVLRSGKTSKASPPRTSVVRMHLFGANQNSELVGLDPLPGKTNYLIGNRPEVWHTNVPQYANVIEHDIYPGVDLSYYGNQRRLESDFIVSPRANARAISMAFTGAKKLRVDSQGNLVVTTDAGELLLRKPVAYQQLTSEKQLVAASYAVQGNRVRFSLGKYDRTHALIIDPILEYSTYLGGSNIDVANAIAVASDSTGFVAGATYSTDFPTAHPLQPNHGGPDDIYKDAFVSKLSADGSTLLYSTYIGGKNDDIANGIAVDTYGDAYVVGTTESPDFPVPSTIPTFNPLCGGDGKCGATWNPNALIVHNAFVIKLNPEGSAPLYSGFIAYYENVFGSAIAVDSNQLAYVVGTVGPNITPTVTIAPPQVPPPPFPISANAAQPTFGGGDYDVFVAVISSTGNSILYSTYLGGTNEDDGYGIAVDNNQNVYVTGLTYSTDFPVTTASAYQAVYGGNGDAFFAKLNTLAGGALNYSTYLGGPNLDQGNAIALDSSDNAYIAGATSSAGLSSSSTYKGQGDAFVAKFNPAASGASSLVYFTYLGGSLADSGNGIGLDSVGNVYITGSTVSTDFPVAGAVFQTQYAGGNSDAFVTKLDPTGSTLLYSTYLGGSNTDAGYGIAVDTDGSAYVAGQTCSEDFPLSNPEQPTYGGNCDAFVSKISILDGIILTPSGLSFPSLNIGATSLPQTVNLVNGDNSVSISNISVMGADPSDFAFTSTCPNPGTLAPGAQCSFSITFSPQVTGLRKAYVSITYMVNGTTLNPVISLTGSTSTVQLSASTLSFATQSVGTASSSQPVIVTNIGTTALTISSITASGDYAETDNCTKAPLQPNTDCSINVTYTPSVAGASTGALTINDNVAGSPQVVLLNGTGLKPDFAITSTPTSATVVAGNSATFTLNIASISGYSQQIGLACSGLPANASCSISPAAVTPTANESTTATVTITTGVRTVIPSTPFVPSWPAPIFSISMLCLLLLVAAATILTQRPRATVVAAFTALLFAVILIGACNGGTAGTPGTPSGTYKVVISGTSSNLSHSTTVSLQVK